MKRTRVSASVLAAVMALGILTIGARPAHAIDKEDLYKYGTYGLGAGTVYAAVKGKGTLALIGAAGTYLAYKGWQKEKDKNNRRDRRHRPIRRRR